MNDNIDRMTDEELVRAVAEEVMGWRSRGGCHHSVNDTATTFGTGRTWRPLESWDDVMMVREPMRQKGWAFFALGDNIGGGVTASFFKQQSTGAKDWYCHEFTPKEDRSETTQHRAILRVALKAVRSQT